MSAALAISTPFAVNDSMPEGYNMPEGCNYARPAACRLKPLFRGATANRFTGSITTLRLGSAQSGTTSTGSIAWRERYTPFGSEIVGNAANDNQAGFTGHIKDSATGLNYMQARYYDPVIGRFLSVDPVTFLDTGEPGMFNRYAYVENDPINMIDPDGRATKTLAVFDGGKKSSFIGGHAAIYVEGRNGKPGVLYDPGGSLPFKDEYGASARGSGDVLTEDKNNPDLLKSFIDYHTTDGGKIEISTVETTAAEETEIKDNFEDNSSVTGGLCASACSGAVSGVGPFKEEGAITPHGLARIGRQAAKASGGSTETVRQEIKEEPIK